MTDQHDPPIDHPTESELADLASGALDPARTSAVSAHVTSCLACRLLFDRLNQGLLDLPGDDLLPDDLPALPDALLAAVARADRPKAGPKAGELWRARGPNGGAATLVWLRTIARAQAAAVPVTFDTELAGGDDTVVVPAEGSPLGIPLALHASAEATIDTATLLDRLGSVDVAAAVESARTSSAGIASLLDPRVEYRQALADELAALAPTHRTDGEAAAGDGWWLLDDRSSRADLLVAVHRALGETHPGARISPRPASAAGSEHLSAVALVTELDAFVLVAFVDRPLDAGALLEEARRALHADQLLNAVGLTEPTAPFMATVVDRRDVVEAIETPSGDLTPPRQSRVPAPVGEALAKFLDAAITPFGRLAATVVDGRAIDARELAVDVAGEAVRAVEASAKGFKVEGKRPGYERVRSHRAAITRLVEAALGDPDVDVESIMEVDE